MEEAFGVEEAQVGRKSEERRYEREKVRSKKVQVRTKVGFCF